MINLLPLEEKQKLSLKYKEKLSIIFGIVFSVALICLILILLAIAFYIQAETNYQENILMQTKKDIQTLDYNNIVNIMGKYNATLVEINSFYANEMYFNQAMQIITNITRPETLYLTSFSLGRNKNGIIRAEISGISDTRNNLLIFKKNIEENKKIKSSYFSPKSWINPKNVEFSVTLEIN